MSRYHSYVSAEILKEVCDLDKLPEVIWQTETTTVLVAHGYDEPTGSYFLDIEPDCEEGIYYGGIGLTKELSKGEYYGALMLLGLEEAANAVALDIPY